MSEFKQSAKRLMGNQWAERYGSVTGGRGGGCRVGWIEFTLTHFNALVVSLRDSFSSSLQNKCAHSEWLNSTSTRLSEHFTVHTVGEKVLQVLNNNTDPLYSV